MANHYTEFKRLFPTVRIRQELPSCAPYSTGTKYEINLCGMSDAIGPYWIEWSTFDAHAVGEPLLSNVEWHLQQARGFACIMTERVVPDHIGEVLERFRDSMMGMAAATYSLLGKEPDPDRCPVLNVFTTPCKGSVATLLRWGFPGAPINPERRCASLGLFRVDVRYGQSRQPMSLALVGPSNIEILKCECKDQASAHQAIIMIRAWLLAAAEASLAACQTPKPIEIEAAIAPPKPDDWD